MGGLLWAGMGLRVRETNRDVESLPSPAKRLDYLPSLISSRALRTLTQLVCHLAIELPMTWMVNIPTRQKQTVKIVVISSQVMFIVPLQRRRERMLSPLPDSDYPFRGVMRTFLTCWQRLLSVRAMSPRFQPLESRRRIFAEVDPQASSSAESSLERARTVALVLAILLLRL